MIKKCVLFIVCLSVISCVNGTITYAEEIHSKVHGTLVEADSSQAIDQAHPTNSSEKKLPSTGENSNTTLLITGVSIILFVLALKIVERRFLNEKE